MKTNLALVSIAICTKDRPSNLTVVLSRISDQMFSLKVFFPIIIIDSSKDDQTRIICEQFQKKNKASTVTYVHRVTHGISIARNTAIELCKARYICFIDDDIIPDVHWLSSIIRHIRKNPNDDILYGPIVPLIGKKKTNKVQERISSFTPWVFTDLSDQSQMPFTANVVIAIALIKRIGKFNTVFGNTTKIHYQPYGEDPEFFQRAISQGALTVYLPDCKVYHSVGSERFTLKYLVKRYIDHGKNMFLFGYYNHAENWSLKNYVLVNLGLFKHSFSRVCMTPPLGLLYFICVVVGQIHINMKVIIYRDYYMHRDVSP